MPIVRKSERHPGSIFTGQAMGLLLVLAIVTADVVSIPVLLGIFKPWQAAVAGYTIISLSVGTIWTVLAFYRPARSARRADNASEVGGRAPENSAE